MHINYPRSNIKIVVLRAGLQPNPSSKLRHLYSMLRHPLYLILIPVPSTYHPQLSRNSAVEPPIYERLFSMSDIGSDDLTMILELKTF